jgi:hypothetical protein
VVAVTIACARVGDCTKTAEQPTDRVALHTGPEFRQVSALASGARGRRSVLSYDGYDGQIAPEIRDLAANLTPRPARRVNDASIASCSGLRFVSTLPHEGCGATG